MAPRDARYRQAAWTYVAYGVVYWLGGLALAQSGLGPRGMERGGAAWFVVGALFVIVIFPWLLVEERGWLDRWLLSRRDFARLLTLLVAYPRDRGGTDRLAHLARRPCPSSGSTCRCARARGPSASSRFSRP